MALLLLFVMSMLSLFLWIGVPVGWMLIAGVFATDPEVWYLLILVAIPTTMIAVGWVLYRVNRVYVRVSGEPSRREPTSWLRSQAADRTSRLPPHAIEVIMVCSVVLAFVAFLIWFFFLSGSPLPPAG